MRFPPGRQGPVRGAALRLAGAAALALSFAVLGSGWAVARDAVRGARGVEPSAGPGRPPGAAVTVVDRAEVFRRFGRPGTTLLDVRPPAAWAEGHIPHSLPLPLDALKNDDGSVMTGADIAPLLRTFGPRRGDPLDLSDTMIVVGTPPPGEAVDPVRALESAGVGLVLHYPGGFDDWRGSPCAPITRQVSTQELAELVRAAQGGRFRDRPARDLVLLDLRYDREFSLGHLPGALLLSSGRFDAEIDSLVDARWPGIVRATTPIAVYCYGPECIRSRIATTLAARHGFRRLLWYREGPLAWSHAGHPLYEGDGAAAR